MTHQQEIKDLPVDGFQEKVFEMLYQFQQEDFMCDAIIFGKDGSVPAHKIILMASSKFFRDKIVNRENYFCESMFYLHDYSVTDIENVIRMFYTGRLMFDRERIGSFSKLCRELHLDGMVKVCQEILIKSHTKGLHRASNMQQKYKRDKLSFYDNVSDISSVPSDSEDSSNTQVQNTIKDSSLIYKSAKSLSELYGLSTRSLHYSSSDHLSDLESTKGNIQASHIKSEEGQISCEVFSSKTGILQSVHTNTICENNSDISKAESNVSNDNSTDESNSRIPIENCLMNSMCSSKPLTALSEDLNLSASSELELSPFHNEGQRNDFSSSGSDKLTDSSNIFSDNDTFTTKFQCKFCSKKFSSLKNLMKHKIRIHKCKTSHKKKNIEKPKYQNSKEHKIKKDEMIMKQEVSKEFTSENGTERKRDENMKTLSKTAFEIQNGCKVGTGLINSRHMQEIVKNKTIDIENNIRNKISDVVNQNSCETIYTVGEQQSEMNSDKAHIKNTRDKTNNVSFEMNNVSLETNNISLEKNNVCLEMNNVSLETNNVTIETNNVSLEMNNITIETNNVSLETNNVSLETNNVSLETNNVSLERNSISLEKNNVCLETNNVCLETNNISLETNNNSLETNNVSLETNNVSLEMNNFTIETNNVGLETNNDSLETNNVRLERNTVFNDTKDKDRTCYATENTLDDSNNVTGKIEGTYDGTLKENKKSSNTLIVDSHVSSDTVSEVVVANSTCVVSNDMSGTLDLNEDRPCIVSNDVIRTLDHNETIDRTCVQTEDSDKTINDTKCIARNEHDAMDLVFSGNQVTKDIDRMGQDTMDSDSIPLDTNHSELMCSPIHNEGKTMQNNESVSKTSVNTKSKDKKIHDTMQTKRTCDDTPYVDNIRCDMGNAEITKPVTKPMETKNMLEGKNEVNTKSKAKVNSNKKSVKQKNNTENSECTENLSKIDKPKTKNCVSYSQKDDSKPKETQSKNKKVLSVKLKSLKKLNSKCKKVTMKSKKQSEFDRVSSSSVNRTKSKMSKERKSKLSSSNDKTLTLKKDKIDLDAKMAEAFEIESKELPYQQDENRGKYSNVGVTDTTSNKKSHRKHENNVDEVPRKKLKTERKPRQSFEDAIGMIYDYRFYKKKNVRRSDSGLSRSSKQENQIFKNNSAGLEEINKTAKKQKLSSDAERKQKSSEYTCRFCRKVFKSRVDLKSHEVIHTGKTNYTCQVCSERFDNKQELQKHFNTHPKNGTYSCGICNKEYRKLGSLRMHLKAGCGKTSFPCDQCGKEFCLKKNLLAHQVTHGNKFSLTCPVCKQHFHTILVLRMHMKNHKKQYECDICCKKFNSEEFLNLHEIHHKTQIEDHFRCNICDLTFTKKKDIAEHVEEHRNQKIRSEEMSSKTEIQSERSEKVEGKSTPTIEKPSTPYNSNLEIASQFDAMADDDKHIDDFESVKGQSSPSIETSSVVYTGEEYMDEETLNEDLESCQRKSKKEESRICGNRVFGMKEKNASKNDKEKESAIGHGSFWCYKCDFFFPDEKSLRKHTMLHIDERPFKCNLCPNSFFRGSELKKHKLKCGIIHKCDVCSLEFSKKYELNSHKSRFHNQSEKNENCEHINTVDSQKPLQKQIIESLEIGDMISDPNITETDKKPEIKFQEDGLNYFSELKCKVNKERTAIQEYNLINEKINQIKYDKNNIKKSKTRISDEEKDLDSNSEDKDLDSSSEDKDLDSSSEDKDLDSLEKYEGNIRTKLVGKEEMDKMKRAVVKIIPL